MNPQIVSLGKTQIRILSTVKGLVSEVAVVEEDALEPPEDDGEISYDLAREFEERIKEVVVKRAINKVDEGSNVLNRVSGNPIIEMRVLASRFSNPEEAMDLDAFLIQEFMHAKDMVDPEFDYEVRPECGRGRLLCRVPHLKENVPAVPGCQVLLVREEDLDENSSPVLSSWF